MNWLVPNVNCIMYRFLPSTRKCLVWDTLHNKQKLTDRTLLFIRNDVNANTCSSGALMINYQGSIDGIVWLIQADGWDSAVSVCGNQDGSLFLPFENELDVYDILFYDNDVSEIYIGAKSSASKFIEWVK